MQKLAPATWETLRQEFQKPHDKRTRFFGRGALIMTASAEADFSLHFIWDLALKNSLVTSLDAFAVCFSETAPTRTSYPLAAGTKIKRGDLPNISLTESAFIHIDGPPKKLPVSGDIFSGVSFEKGCAVCDQTSDGARIPIFGFLNNGAMMNNIAKLQKM